MNELTCVVVGGGYAGINAVKAIQKELGPLVRAKSLRLIMIDKQSRHLRKVLLFKPASGPSDITVPLSSLFPEGVQWIQGSVSQVKGEDRCILYTDVSGSPQCLRYDILVLALGSIVRQTGPEQGGIALTGLEAAASIRERWRDNMRQAAQARDPAKRQQLLSLAVAGAGISGIETAAELSHAMRQEAAKLGITTSEVKVYLLNARSGLFPEGSPKMALKLERALADGGVTVLHDQKALHEKEGTLTLSGGQTIPVGLCVWTLGLVPNPVLRSLGLPVTNEGQLIVDASYRATSAPGVYAIGDCARIVDPGSGQADRMTCKEATAQASRLGKVIAADLAGRPAPVHKSFMDFYCIGLGPGRGMLWTRQFGLNLVIAGKLGWTMRKLTWNMASLVNKLPG